MAGRRLALVALLLVDPPAVQGSRGPRLLQRRLSRHGGGSSSSSSLSSSQAQAAAGSGSSSSKGRVELEPSPHAASVRGGPLAAAASGRGTTSGGEQALAARSPPRRTSSSQEAFAAAGAAAAEEAPWPTPAPSPGPRGVVLRHVAARGGANAAQQQARNSSSSSTRGGGGGAGELPPSRDEDGALVNATALAQQTTNIEDVLHHLLGGHAEGKCFVNDVGVRMGCASHCSCGWFEQCFPHNVHWTDPKTHQLQRINVGACRLGMHFLIVLSVVIFLLMISTVVVLRMVLQFLESARVDADAGDMLLLKEPLAINAAFLGGSVPSELRPEFGMPFGSHDFQLASVATFTQAAAYPQNRLQSFGDVHEGDGHLGGDLITP